MAKLKETTVNLDCKINKTRKELDVQHENFVTKFNNTVEDHQNQFEKSAKKVRLNVDQLDQHKA